MNTESIPTLPALRSLGNLAGVRPVIVIDSREQMPLRFIRLPFRTLREEEGEGLYSGDYSIAGCETLFAIERKSIPDLVSCCGPGRERFERELHRLRGFRFARVIVTGPRSDIEASNYRSAMAPRAVLATVCAFEARYGLPFIFAASESAAADQVEVWAYWFAREVVENVNDLARAAKVKSSIIDAHERRNPSKEQTLTNP